MFEEFPLYEGPVAVRKAGLEKSLKDNFKLGVRHSAVTRSLLPGFVFQYFP